ncbi:GPP34 family phosphoprotein [Streptomyces sp. GMY02]|uniref:GOLPH3/VPS74 family protein n=1 Tax=Streptomyces sp. GMY02 TaxID=1333528 RepID=UPI001C2B7D36|nr:GPP34 family phosphoprotein [Streptomyces sp. GMY02]QXE37897.1 GPP34 family phosphoprotein [Streptomyces sp. GMY02]
MHDRPFRTLPEELLLACVDPDTGVVRRPDFFNRVLSGAVFAELDLCGAITIENLRIVELRPVTLGEPVIDSISEEFVTYIRRGQPNTGQTRLVGPRESLDALRPELPRGVVSRLIAGARIGISAASTRLELQGWISGWPGFRDIEPRYLEALETSGLLTAHRRRVLGIVPRTTWSVVSPEHARHAAATIDEAVRAVVYGAGPGAPSPRAVCLVALVGSSGLAMRLYPGPGNQGTRDRIEQITEGHPIGAAVSAAREADWKAREAD